MDAPPLVEMGEVGGNGPFKGGGVVVVGTRRRRVDSLTAEMDETEIKAAASPWSRFGGVKGWIAPALASFSMAGGGAGDARYRMGGIGEVTGAGGI